MYFILIKTFVKRDIKDRFVGSILGPLLFFIHPLLNIIVFIFIFKIVFKVKIHFMGKEADFLPFFLAGFLPWTLHAESVSRGTSAILQHAHLVTKVKFPVEVLPISSVISTYLAGSLGIPLLLIILGIISGFKWQSLGVVIFLVPSFLISLGFVFVLSSLAVYFRDILHLISIFLTIWFYGTPILYSQDMLSGHFKALFILNPMTPIVESWQRLLINGQFLWDYFLRSLLESLLLIILGWVFFQKVKRGFGDIL